MPERSDIGWERAGIGWERAGIRLGEGWY